MFPFRVLVACSLVLAGGCRTPDAPPRARATATFSSPRDDLGRAIALNKPASRVIIIGPGAVETMWELGAQSKLVGRDDYAAFPPDAKKVAVAGNYQGPNIEQCVALRPDLVVVQGETWDVARVEAWQSQIGVPVAALTPTNLAKLRGDIAKLGAWTGSERAGALNAKLQARALKSGPRAFVEIERSTLYTAGAGTLVDDVLRASGFANAANVRGYQAFGIESLVAAEPDVYVVPSRFLKADVLRQLRAHASLSKLRCVRQGRIVVIDDDLLLRAGPRLAQGIEVLKREAEKLGETKNSGEPNRR